MLHAKFKQRESISVSEIKAPLRVCFCPNASDYILNIIIGWCNALFYELCFLSPIFCIIIFQIFLSYCYSAQFVLYSVQGRGLKLSLVVNLKDPAHTSSTIQLAPRLAGLMAADRASSWLMKKSRLRLNLQHPYRKAVWLSETLPAPLSSPARLPADGFLLKAAENNTEQRE